MLHFVIFQWYIVFLGFFKNNASMSYFPKDTLEGDNNLNISDASLLVKGFNTNRLFSHSHNAIRFGGFFA